jgi:hypothetical protein
MVGNGNLSNSIFVICGAASDSLVMVLSISGAVAFFALMLGLFVGTKRNIGYTNEPLEHGILRTKPLLVPSLAFVISLVLVIALVPHPMSAYHGPNEQQIHFYEEDMSKFTVYDSAAYQNTIEIHVLAFLDSSETLEVRVTFHQNDTEIATTSATLVGNSLSQVVTEDLTIQLQPGQYEVEVPGRNYNSVTLSQPLVSGFFDEVLDWETYTMLMTVGSFFFVLLGLCYSTETRKRYSYERIDQEPPKDGADYARRA